MKVSFGTAIIQKARRIALDHNLLENLQLAVGDRLRVFLDTDTQSLILEKDLPVSSKKTKMAPRRGGGNS